MIQPEMEQYPTLCEVLRVTTASEGLCSRGECKWQGTAPITGLIHGGNLQRNIITPREMFQRARHQPVFQPRSEMANLAPDHPELGIAVAKFF